MQVKNSFATRVNELSVLKLFQLSNGDLLFSKHDYSLYKVCKPRMTKLGQGVGTLPYRIEVQQSLIFSINFAISFCTPPPTNTLYKKELTYPGKASKLYTDLLSSFRMPGLFLVFSVKIVKKKTFFFSCIIYYDFPQGSLQWHTRLAHPLLVLKLFTASLTVIDVIKWWNKASY